MRVCFYNHDAQLYGASKSLLNLLEEIRQNEGIRIVVVLPEEGPLQVKLRELKIETLIIENEPWVSGIRVENLYTLFRYLFYFSQRLFHNFALTPQHLKFIRKWNPDLIYSNSGVVALGFLMAKVLKKKHVWHLREFIDKDHGLKLDFGFKSLRFGLRNSDLVVAVSKPVLEYVFPACKNKAIVVPNGVCKKREFEKRIELWKKKEKKPTFTFSIIGFVSGPKGQISAVKDFAKLAQSRKDLRLIIAGKGGGESFTSMVEKINNQIEGKIEQLGHVDNIQEIYLQTDCLLMCSKNEAFGRVTVEAMSYGIPVIGFNSMGTKEIITDGKNGYLYGPGFSNLAQVMQRVERNYEEALSIGTEGWKEAKEKFSQEQYAKTVYQNLLIVHGKA